MDRIRDSQTTDQGWSLFETMNLDLRNVDSRPGRGKGYENATIIPHADLKSVDKLTDRQLKILEDPLERINQTKEWVTANKRRDEILAQMRKAKL